MGKTKKNLQTRRNVYSKKIGDFGHFGTSVVQPLDLDQVIEEKAASKNSLEKIQEEPAVGEAAVASKNDLENNAAEEKPAAASKIQILEKSKKVDIVETKADKREKRDANGEMSMKQDPFRIDAVNEVAIV